MIYQLYAWGLSTLVSDCICVVIAKRAMPPKFLNNKPCGGSVSACFTALYRFEYFAQYVCHLFIRKDSVFTPHFINSCASVNATGVIVNCNKAPDIPVCGC